MSVANMRNMSSTPSPHYTPSQPIGVAKFTVVFFPRLGLHQTRSHPIQAQIRQKSFADIPTLHAPYSRPLSFQMNPTLLRRQSSTSLSEETLTLQNVCGTFLFYGRAVNPTMVHELSCLASAQAHGTKATIAQMVHF
jgi:hypothetical protein